MTAPDVVTEMFAAYRTSLDSLEGKLGSAFSDAVDLLEGMSGTVVVCGMGKSGLVGAKITATLTSTGTPSVFLHPAEAMHGDLGIVRKGDLIILISNSGETEEITRLLPALKRLAVRIIALVGNVDSTMARAADICLDAAIDKEACPLNLAPTTSTLAALVLGDALAVALMERRGFRPADFAATHPGGKLGKKLLHTAKDHMRSHDLPFVGPKMLMSEVVAVMTEGRLGLALVGAADDLRGIITDGDLRRTLVEGHDLSSLTAEQVMNPTPQTISANASYGQAEEMMLEAKIQALVVLSDERLVEGIIQIF